ncbi:pentatricopeptide repeat-containing protein At1g50270-like [Malus domestica]|uniref:pentatricopeptide repeat-containing protein At1g50270-like n=1 Tax=Malus domestica TaxID=3750 RepID=UPI0039755CC0
MDCGCVDEAWAVFNQMPEKDVISCTEMIRANVKRGCFNEGLKLFRQMVGDGVKPDPLSVSSVLPACARMSAGKHGKETRGFLLRHGIRMNLTVLNALVDMYVKSGFIKSAAKVFARLKYRDLVSWTVMITGYSLHGQGKIGVDLFCQMEKETSTQIDEITYAAVLHACVAARMVEEGKFYFNCIKTPTVAHCALFVTLLSRSELFYEAKNFIADKKTAADPVMPEQELKDYEINLKDCRPMVLNALFMLFSSKSPRQYLHQYLKTHRGPAMASLSITAALSSSVSGLAAANDFNDRRQTTSRS